MTKKTTKAASGDNRSDRDQSVKQIRDCIKDFKRIPASELVVNEKNWRQHTADQADAMRGILQECGFAGACIVFQNESGEYELIDGHLRRQLLEDHELVPCLVLDVDRGQADRILAFFDSIGQLAETNRDALTSLLVSFTLDDAGARRFQDFMVEDISLIARAQERGLPEGTQGAGMDLLPHEHYDAIMILCRNTNDFHVLAEKLALKPAKKSNRFRKAGIGLARAVEAKTVLELLK